MSRYLSRCQVFARQITGRIARLYATADETPVLVPIHPANQAAALRWAASKTVPARMPFRTAVRSRALWMQYLTAVIAMGFVSVITLVCAYIAFMMFVTGLNNLLVHLVSVPHHASAATGLPTGVVAPTPSVTPSATPTQSPRS
jgi:hypothetical protein